MFTLKVIGYYDHYNIGDEQYKITFIELFNKYLGKNEYNIDFIDCDKLQGIEFSDSDIIIVGGGDVLSDYFLDKLILKFKGKKNKIIAVSVGLPFKSVLTNSDKINIFDYIFIRSLQDIELFTKYYGEERIKYINDLSCLLGSNINNIIANKFITLDKKRKNIAVSLTRYYRNNNDYEIFIKNLSTTINSLLKLNKYNFIFIPFNTNINNFYENDTIIQRDLIDKLNLKKENLLVFNEYINEKDIMYVLNNHIDYCIAMRYHACLFSYHTEVPFFPIYSTRKIDNFLLDINWEDSYKLKDCNINIDDLIFKLNIFLEKKNFTYKKIIDNNIPFLIDKIKTKYNKNNINLFIKYKYIKVNEIYKIIEQYYKSKGYHTLYFIDNVDVKHTIVNIVSYYLTNGSYNSIYNHGLMDKMFNKNYNYKLEWSWILDDFIPHKIINNPTGKYNLKYIDQKEYSNCHRSGWEYVFNNIKHLHNDNGVLLDLYLDRTFHWNLEANKVVGIVPYKNNWVGVIHHTFNTTFSDYNNVNLLKNKDFLTSLKYCKGLIVLSQSLKKQLISELYKIGYKHIKVHYICHPTELDIQKFKIDKFIDNKNKKILHIGGWLRNIYTFYNININNIKVRKNLISQCNTYQIDKVCLKGKNMDNYYPDNRNTELIQHTNKIHMDKNCCIDNKKNNWYRQLYVDICNKINSIKLIDRHIDNNEYDKLLSENIVFIHLVDASAVNTVIECIARNTPIIINKLPAITELLGDKYPLYYDGSKNYIDISNDINILLMNENNLTNAYYYIKKLDKKYLDINNFIKELMNI